MKKLLRLTHRGDMSIGNMIVVILTFFISMILILAYSSWHKQLSIYDSIDLTASSYMKGMENTGCLTDIQKSQLISDLEQLGLKNISLDGTSETDVGYGGEMKLHISGMLDLTGIPVIGAGADFTFDYHSEKSIDIEKSGISHFY